MPGRRWSDGLHQAIEAKEGVTVQQENITLATITFQNFFRLYDKLAGMTGTALTESEEFDKIYKLEVVPIPTNQPMIRKDEADLIYKTEDAKYNAVGRRSPNATSLGSRCSSVPPASRRVSGSHGSSRRRASRTAC